MAIIRGLRSQMTYLGLLLVVCCMFLTGVCFAANSTSLPIITMSQTAIKSSSTSPSPSSQTIASVSITPTPATLTTPPTSSQGTTGTNLPIIHTTPAPMSSGRKFDGVSFFGGIILGAVLAVIFFFAYKWWQTRNKSYHSL